MISSYNDVLALAKKTRFEYQTAFDLAPELGNNKLLNALDRLIGLLEQKISRSLI